MSRAEYPRLPHNLSELPDAAELLEFNEVLLRACAKDTRRRYRQAEELLADLALMERGASIKRLRRLERRHVALRRISAGVLALGLLISAAWWQSWRAHQSARRHLAQLHVSEGTQRMVQGEYAAALPWLEAALELDANDPLRERAHRVRIANVLDRCPMPAGHFSVPQSTVLAADLSPDGTSVATAHEDGQVLLWNKRTGECIQQVAHGFPVVLCQFLPSGTQLLTVTMDQKAHVWNLARPGSEPRTFDQVIGFDSDVYGVGLNQMLHRAYLSKGRHRFVRTNAFSGETQNLTLGLSLAGQDDTLRVRYGIRRNPDGRTLYQGEFHDSPAADPFDAGLDSPPAPLWGRVLVLLESSSMGNAPGDHGRVVWDAFRVREYPSGEAPPRWSVLDDFSAATSHNWMHATVPGATSTFRIENGRLTLSCDDLPRTHLGWTGVMWRGKSFEVGPGKTLEFEADLVSVEAPHPHAGLTLCRPILSPLTAPDRVFVLDGRRLILTGWDRAVRIWDLEHRQRATVPDAGKSAPLEIRPGQGALDLDVSPDGRWLAHVGSLERFSLWDLRSADELPVECLRESSATGVRFSPDNRFMAVSHNRGLELIPTGGWQSALSLGKGEAFKLPRFSSRGLKLAAVRNAHDVVVWDLGDTGSQPAAFALEFDVTRMIFSPDGRYLASSSADGMVRVWDVIHEVRFGPPLTGTVARFTADGAQLLVTVERGAWLWDLTTIRDEALPVPPMKAERRSDLSKDRATTAEIAGQRLLLRTRTDRHALVAPVQAPMRRVAFSPDGRHVIAESSDLRAWIWDVPTRSLAAPPLPIRIDAALEHHPSPGFRLETRDPRALADIASLLGGQRLDGERGMRPVDEAERGRILNGLRARPPHLVPGANRARWHRAQASSAERAMDWEAAVFHWEHALHSDSGARNEADESRAGIDDPQTGIAPEVRLAYARQCAELVRQRTFEGRSRWSVILPRPPWAEPGMLNLDAGLLPLGEPVAAGSKAPCFRELPSGVQVLGRIPFCVRGVLPLKSTQPVTVAIGRPCRRIHFLHAGKEAVTNSGIRGRAGWYQVNYSGGESVAVTLQNPDDVPPYSASDFLAVSRPSWPGTSPGLHCALVWSGCMTGAGRNKEMLFITKTTWELPVDHRDDIVETLELKAAPAGLEPLVFAVTVE